MRICMVTTFYPPYHFGGDATYVRSLSRALVERGHEVEVIHCEDAYHAVSKVNVSLDMTHDRGIIVHRLKSHYGFISALVTQQSGRPGLKASVLRRLLSRNFDVVNFHNISLVGGPGVLGFSQAPVTLYTMHEHWLLCPMHIFWKNRSHVCDRPQCFTCSLKSGIPPQWWRYTGLLSRSMQNVDMLISPSEYTARRHREGGFTQPTRVLPLFSMLDPGELPEYVPPERPRFLFVGRVTASKGVLPMLAYFSGRDDIDLWIIGEGDLRQKLQQRYAGARNIRFFGLVPQVELVDLYRQATALIFPSLAPETFGLSIAEAFACGTPAVVRDAGGSRELIDRTGAGFVYRSQSELNGAVDRIAHDSFLRAELGKVARQGFEQFYTQQKHVDGYLECIADIQRSKGSTVH